MATIYRFTVWDSQRGEIVTAKRAATMEAIKRAQGEAIPSSARDVDSSSLDGNGFLKLESGDVVMEHQSGSALYAYGTVDDAGQMPTLSQTGTKHQAEEWARNWLEATGGTLHRLEIPEGR